MSVIASLHSLLSWKITKKLNDEEMIERLKIYLVECRYTCVCELISFKTSAPREYIWEMREQTRERERKKGEKWKITSMRFDVKLMLDDRGYDFFSWWFHTRKSSGYNSLYYAMSIFVFLSFSLSLSLSFFPFVIVS